MKDRGQQARASENFAGPVDFETPRPDLPVHFLNFKKPWFQPFVFCVIALQSYREILKKYRKRAITLEKIVFKNWRKLFR